MPQPSSGTSIPRADLGIVAEAARDDAIANGFIGGQVLPIVRVADQASDFPVIPLAALFADEDTKRAMRGYYNRSDWDFEMGFYSTRENGWEEALDDRELKIYRRLFDAESVAVRRAVKVIVRAQEKRIAAMVNTTANFFNTAATAAWSDATNGKPLTDIKLNRAKIRDECGMLPNTLILPWVAFENAKRCAEVVELLKYTFPGQEISSMSAAQLAQVFDIPKVLVAGAMVNGAAKGQAADLAEVWDASQAILTITSDSEDPTEPCLGRTFLWTEESGDGEGGTIVEEYRTEGNRSNIYRVRHDSQERLLKSYDDSGNVKSDIAKAVTHVITGVTA